MSRADGLVHEAVVFGTDDELVDATVPFLREGLEQGQPTVLHLEQHARRVVLDALGDRSGVIVLDPEHYARPYGAMRLNRRLFDDLVRRASGQVRVIGTVPNARETWHGWSRYEAAINHLMSDMPIWAVCLYDRRSTADDVLADVERTHPRLCSPGAGRRQSASYVDPHSFLAERAARDVDPLERTPPHLRLDGPTPGAARHEVAALARAAGLGARAVHGLEVAVTEVVTNAIVHGRPPVEVRAWAAPDRVAVAVRDGGPGPADPWVGMVPGGGDGGGLGLHIAYQTCSELTLAAGRDGFTVHLVVRSA